MEQIIVQNVMSILNNFHNINYYVYNSIPPKKLKNAMDNYLANKNDQTIIALIDTTIFGSAKTGMLLAGKGIYWKNMWAVPTRKNFLSWEDLVMLKDKIFTTNDRVRFDVGIEFHVVLPNPSYLKDNLLLPLISIYSNFGKIYSDTKLITHPVIEEQHNTIALTSESDIYQLALVNAFALITYADGSVQEEEVDAVISFIEADDDILDKSKAIDNFTTIIKQLEQELLKSKAFFKLRINKSLGEIRKLSNKLWRENIFVMVEGIYDSKDTGDIKVKRISDEIEMLERLRKELS